MKSELPVISVAVTALAAFVHRSGGLGRLTYSSFSGSEGTRLHRLFYSKLEDYLPDYEGSSEVRLTADFATQDLILRVQGRADLMLHEPTSGERWPLEVKTTAAALVDLPGGGDPLHWAQARLYAWLEQAQNPSPAGRTRYGLAYLSALENDVIILTREESLEELEAWFRETAGAYLSFARNIRVYRERRDRSIRAMRFPYPHLREGQRDFMRRVLQQLRSRGSLLVEAPTGTGKTMSTLYPAIKGLGAGMMVQIFYLTARTSTGDVAWAAVRTLQDQGLVLRMVQLTAKEKLCPIPDLFCDTILCPYARDYYQHARAAIDEGLLHLAVNSELVTELAKKHSVCPFELQLDISSYADLIIGDYNYAFDPRVRLERFFGERVFRHALLIDEAHNLPDRARHMYSQALELANIQELRRRLATELPRAASVLDSLIQYLEAAERHISADARGQGALLLAEKAQLASWPELEPELTAIPQLQAERFLALRAPMPGLNRILGWLVMRLRDVLESLDAPELRRRTLDIYFAVLFFLRIMDAYWGPSFILTASARDGPLVFSALCLDASAFIRDTYRGQHSAVFFSATLSPLFWFARAFGGPDRDDRPDILQLHSPFPAENRLVVLHQGIDTDYQRRGESAPELARAIALAALRANGNALCFFPSYAYMELVMPRLEAMLKRYDISLLRQTRQMNDAQRRAFLAAFEADTGATKTLGVAVLGGSFGEGIDLVGERLTAVIVVGVGLPGIGPEREILRQYYDERDENGFQQAYLFPGFIRVLQAAGRLIRSDLDTGFILLIDRRYGRPDYRQLLPEDWSPHSCDTLEELNALLLEAPQPEPLHVDMENTER
ncbi:MAG: ATP-dependent DNA helicase [Bacillota bacterium]|nr:ATP-dependent DNA helicase [Bacillota bacterium]